MEIREEPPSAATSTSSSATTATTTTAASSSAATSSASASASSASASASSASASAAAAAAAAATATATASTASAAAVKWGSIGRVSKRKRKSPIMVPQILGRVGVLFLIALSISAVAEAACPSNAELWAGGTLCRCRIGFIENRGACPRLDLATAKVRALEIQKKEATDCVAMSVILNELSRAVGFDADQLVEFAGKVLSDGIRLRFRHTGTLYTLVPPANQDYVRFHDNGFRASYRDDSNQVRHFVGYFTLGVKYRGDWGTVTGFLTELRDRGEQPDIDLGNLAAALGRQAAGSQHMMENVGRLIRSQVCE